jgi:hypothetical protein
MPISSDEAEKLAQHYFLTPDLIQEAAQLFDLYTKDDKSFTAESETRISVKCLQQLLVALGAPLSQQDVVEVLQLFSSAASTAAPTTAATTTAGAAVATIANVNGSSPRLPHTSSASPARKGKAANRSNTIAGIRSQLVMQPPARHTTSTSNVTPTAEAGVLESRDAHCVEDELGDDGTFSTMAVDAATGSSASAAEIAGSIVGEEAPGGDSPALATAAVNVHGMTFPAFVYFLMVYPTMVQHISTHTAAAPSATTSAFAQVNVAELFAQLDCDGDGVCSAQDIRHVAEGCATDYDGLLLDDPDLCRLAAMHPVELEAATREFDLDGDGMVTLSDLQQALQ